MLSVLGPDLARLANRAARRLTDTALRLEASTEAWVALLDDVSPW